MTIASLNRQSPAEAQLLEAYTAALSSLPGDGAVMAARDALLHALRTGGLPTRRVESWHYTDLKTLLKAVPAAAPAAQAESVDALVLGSRVLPLANGATEAQAEAGDVAVTRFADLLASGEAAASLAERGTDDAIGRINGSFVRDGYALDFPAGLEIAQPIELQVNQAGGQSHSRFPARFGANSKAVVIERHRAVSEAQGFVSSVSDLVLEEGAEITWIILQTQGLTDTHLGQIKVVLNENAKLRLFVINAGGKLVRQEIHVVTAGSGSNLTLRGVNLLGGDSHTDVTLTLGHDVPDTTSTEIIRSVVFDRARGVFQGMIRVAPDAQKTDARMACNTLLMSDDAEFSVKPELEIFADDVQCAHGATVADIDRHHLYYLMARGVPKKQARGLLINAFVAEIVEELEDEVLVEALEGVIADWLERHS
jgi:Fe-S cluster assembly protein SufD